MYDRIIDPFPTWVYPVFGFFFKLFEFSYGLTLPLSFYLGCPQLKIFIHDLETSRLKERRKRYTIDSGFPAILLLHSSSPPLVRLSYFT